jgi:small subunit ribosomal protein S3e
LGEDGYAGVEVRVTPMRTEIIIRATRTQNVLGEKGRRIRELTSLVQKRFLFPEGNVELYAERVQNRALSAIAQAESLRFKLLGGLAVRRACYGVMRYVMENGAKGVEVIISGKLRAARAKAMKFRDGYMIKSGDAVNHYIDFAVRHIQLKQVRSASRCTHTHHVDRPLVLHFLARSVVDHLFGLPLRLSAACPSVCLLRVCWVSR